MLPVPAIRASAVHDALAFLDEFEAGARLEVTRRVPNISRLLIEQTPRSGWIPIEHDHYVVDAIIEVFGQERAIQFWSAVTQHLVQRPLLKHFVSGMTRLFGNDPLRVISLLPKAWPLGYRAVCVPVLVKNPAGQPLIRFEQAAPEIRQYSNYFHSWHGLCCAFAKLADVRGEVRFTVAPDLSHAEALFSWELAAQ